MCLDVAEKRIGQRYNLLIYLHDDVAWSALPHGDYFHIIGNMETKEAIDALAALAQETRLGIFRLLVEAGPEGMTAGSIGEQLGLAPATLSFHLAGLAPATLSFHLAGLARAGVARSRNEGRFVIYSADFQTTNALVAYLTENCCGGRACAPAAKPIAHKGKNHEALPRARRRA